MPMTLLAQLCAAQIPLRVVDQDAIEKLAVLRAASFVEAEFPPLLTEGGCRRYAGAAVVIKVTPGGYAAAKADRTRAGVHSTAT